MKYLPLLAIIAACSSQPPTSMYIAGDGTHAGAALAIGDLDGDGQDDLAVGAPNAGVVGQVHVFFGPLEPGAEITPDHVLQASRRGPFGTYFGEKLSIADGKLIVRQMDDFFVFDGAELPDWAGGGQGYEADTTGATVGEYDGEDAMYLQNGEVRSLDTGEVIGNVNVDLGRLDVGPVHRSGRLGVAKSTPSAVRIIDGSEQMVVVRDSDNALIANNTLLTGDLNDDGFPDLVFARSGWIDGDFSFGRVEVLFGPFIESQKSKLLVKADRGQVGRGLAVIGDFDGDGRVELATGGGVLNGRHETAGIAIFDHRGQTRWIRGRGNDFGRVMAGGGDLDGDGFPDFATSSAGESEVTIVFGG